MHDVVVPLLGPELNVFSPSKVVVVPLQKIELWDLERYIFGKTDKLFWPILSREYAVVTHCE